MSLFKNRLIGLSLMALLFGQVSAQASDKRKGLALLVEPVQEVSRARRVFNNVKHTTGYVTTGISLGLLGYLGWASFNDQRYFTVSEFAVPAATGAAAGLFGACVTTCSANAVVKAEQARLHEQKMHSLRLARVERDYVETMVTAQVEKDRHIRGYTALEQEAAQLREATSQAQERAVELDLARKKAEESLAAISKDLDAIKRAGKKLDRNVLAGVAIGLQALQAQHDTLATLTDGLSENNPRKAANQVTLNNLAATLNAVQELETHGIVPSATGLKELGNFQELTQGE